MPVQLSWLLLALTPAGEAPAANNYPRAGLLVEADALAGPAAKDKWRALDARGPKAYEKGHVPGAVPVDTDEWDKAFYKAQDPREWAGRLARLGIAADTPVVVYDDGSAKSAARVWWILRHWGVADVRLLNGGWKAWQAGGHPVSREAAEMRAVRPAELKPTGRLADKEAVLGALAKKSAQVIDARSHGEFCGDVKLSKRGGAVPGALHLEWTDVLDNKTGRFKPAPELRELFRAAGIDLGRPAVTHCQSGGRSSVMAFALELMGADGVQNYYRGWSEWGNAEDTPVAQPEKK